MALIANFIKQDREKFSVHDPIDATVYVLGDGAEKLIQIDTFGRASRDKPGKVSQSIQLDAKSALALYEILKAEFNLS